MSTPAEFHYAFHGLANCRLRVREGGARQARTLAARFAAFAVGAAAAQEPDLDIEIGRFRPEVPADALIVDKKFHVAPGYLFFRGERGGGATEVRGLEGGALVLRHDPVPELPWRRLTRGLRGINLYADPLLAWRLDGRGAWLLHAGAVARDGAAMMILGGNGTGKTRLVLELCLHQGWTFLADDFLIVKDGLAYPCVEHEFVLHQRAMCVAAGARPAVDGMALWRYLGGGDVPRCPGLSVAPAPVPVSRLVMLEAGLAGTSAATITERSAAQVWRQAMALEDLELVKAQRRHRQLTPFARFLMAYEYARPRSAICRRFLLDRPEPPAGLAALPACAVRMGPSWDPSLPGRLTAAYHAPDPRVTRATTDLNQP